VLRGRGGGSLLPLWGLRDSATIDKGHITQCSMPVLSSAIICIYRALQQAVSFAIHKREVARGLLDSFQECGPSVGPQEGGCHACECDDWVCCQYNSGKGANGLMDRAHRMAWHTLLCSPALDRWKIDTMVC
jgi:hypothetical protein